MGKTNLRSPLLEQLEGSIRTTEADTELLKRLVRVGTRPIERNRIEMEHRNRVTSRRKTRRDGIEIGLDATGITEPVVGNENPHLQKLRPGAHTRVV